jgi:hypothetical protein
MNELINEFPHISILGGIITRELHVMLLSKCELCENGPSGSCTFCVGVNGITFIHIL